MYEAEDRGLYGYDSAGYKSQPFGHSSNQFETAQDCVDIFGQIGVDLDLSL